MVSFFWGNQGMSMGLVSILPSRRYGLGKAYAPLLRMKLSRYVLDFPYVALDLGLPALGIMENPLS